MKDWQIIQRVLFLVCFFWRSFYFDCFFMVWSGRAAPYPGQRWWFPPRHRPLPPNSSLPSSSLDFQYPWQRERSKFWNLNPIQLRPCSFLGNESRISRPALRDSSSFTSPSPFHGIEVWIGARSPEHWMGMEWPGIGWVSYQFMRNRTVISSRAWPYVPNMGF